jgi:2,3-bisphosphoglycerate-independent phosphoglycerate mutase
LYQQEPALVKRANEAIAALDHQRAAEKAKIFLEAEKNLTKELKDIRVNKLKEDKTEYPIKLLLLK